MEYSGKLLQFHITVYKVYHRTIRHLVFRASWNQLSTHASIRLDGPQQTEHEEKIFFRFSFFAESSVSFPVPIYDVITRTDQFPWGILRKVAYGAWGSLFKVSLSALCEKARESIESTGEKVNCKVKFWKNTKFWGKLLRKSNFFNQC